YAALPRSRLPRASRERADAELGRSQTGRDCWRRAAAPAQGDDGRRDVPRARAHHVEPRGRGRCDEADRRADDRRNFYVVSAGIDGVPGNLCTMEMADGGEAQQRGSRHGLMKGERFPLIPRWFLLRQEETMPR